MSVDTLAKRHEEHWAPIAGALAACASDEELDSALDEFDSGWAAYRRLYLSKSHESISPSAAAPTPNDVVRFA